MVNDYSYVFLSRPRRFGKSLLSSTLRCYLEGKKELFEGLKIMNLEEKWEQHPVLHFDFSGLSNITIDKLENSLHLQLSHFEGIYGKNPDEKYPNERLEGLIRRAYEKTGNKVGLLIDEYDAPLLDVLHIPDKLEGVRGEMTNFYSPIKKSDQYLKFVFLTGITKFSQLSIFSKLNNLTDISMFPQYSAICGITQQELERDFKEPIVEFSKTLDISEEALKSLLKDNYDGYHFSEDLTDVYNPFSLISAFGNKRIFPYWFASATPTFFS
jgi:Predicted AAA-ATPase.